LISGEEQGDLLFQVCRFDPKDFRQRRPDGKGGWEWKVKGTRQVPYRLPDLIATPPDATVYIVEGEKDVDNLVKLGLAATCNPGGAAKRRNDGKPGRSKWRREFNEFFRGRDVVVVGDNDDAGHDHARAIAGNLALVARSIRILELPGRRRKGTFPTGWPPVAHVKYWSASPQQ
jgi:putative DNA primase/helicase